jgi:hypothetical protein
MEKQKLKDCHHWIQAWKASVTPMPTVGTQGALLHMGTIQRTAGQETLLPLDFLCKILIMVLKEINLTQILEKLVE